jgi:hypothetical protein
VWNILLLRVVVVVVHAQILLVALEVVVPVDLELIQDLA